MMFPSAYLTICSDSNTPCFFIALRNDVQRWTWWLTSLIPAQRRLRQEDWSKFKAGLIHREFQTSLKYKVSHCLKTTKDAWKPQPSHKLFHLRALSTFLVPVIMFFNSIKLFSVCWTWHVPYRKILSILEVLSSIVYHRCSKSLPLCWYPTCWRSQTGCHHSNNKLSGQRICHRPCII